MTGTVEVTDPADRTAGYRKLRGHMDKVWRRNIITIVHVVTYELR